MKWKFSDSILVTLAVAMLSQLSAFAQMEKMTEEEYREAKQTLPRFYGKSSSLSEDVKKHFLNMDEKGSSKQILNAVRLGTALNALKTSNSFVWFSVPAMSELQRLPDTYPLDGKIGAPLKIIMAQDEYEPASFVLYSFKGSDKAELSLTPFRSEEGAVFPAEALDLKVIKVWYQNGNGWYSYFGDTGLKLTPELLLNDENLIKVDTANEQNYARLTEKDGSVSYQWISAPLEIDKRMGYPSYRKFEPFQSMKENFQDAKTLQPFSLPEGEFKQFFLTAHTSATQKPGLYKGAVKVKTAFETVEIPAVIRVLPFVLPKPCTYADPEKPFLVASYSYISLEMIKWLNGGNSELSKKQLEAVLADQVAHNQDLHWHRGALWGYEYELTDSIMKKVGMRKDYSLGSGVPFSGGTRAERRHYAKLAKKYINDRGYKTIFFGYGDEPSATWVINHRELFEDYQSQGLKFIIAGGDQVFFAYGYGYDFFNTACDPEDREATRKWNEIGHAWVAWYASQHVGSENPAFNRRQNGFAPYLANYSALCNYAHHFGPYNDRRETYKPMVFAYGSGSGVIDTLGWEGFREGVDDIRYATLLKRLVNETEMSSDIKIQQAGRAALQHLVELDLESCDLNEARLEMIRHILKLRSLLNK